MAQPQPPPQPQPLSGAPAHTCTVTAANTRVFTAEDERSLALRSGSVRNLTRAHNFQVIPIWSDPAWDGTYTRIATDAEYFEMSLSTGDRVAWNRPAIRGDDLKQGRILTEYARRFGESTSRKTPGVWRHSVSTDGIVLLRFPILCLVQLYSEPHSTHAIPRAMRAFGPYDEAAVLRSGAIG